ncbi:MAG: hypothetical protein KFW07_03240 [Mycoplasmataceae bacterium]|nr:hypothetical protein [Mycoplasmataceae bacterium]
MNLKKYSFFILSVSTPIISSIALSSCSSSVDQKFINNFYSKIVNTEREWTGNSNVYASSVYDLATFRSTFMDQLPTDAELLAKGFKMTLENISPIDGIGKSNYRVYLKNAKNDTTYLPTPTKIDDDLEERIVDFTISGFLQEIKLVKDNFEIEYNKLQSSYQLNDKGKAFFKEHNVETNISYTDSLDDNSLSNLFDWPINVTYKLSGFKPEFANDESKTISFWVFLKDDTPEQRTKGPGKVVTLTLE